MCRYLDSVTNKDSTLPPIPHLHSLLTDDGEPHPEVDIFKLVRSSYEVWNCLVLCVFVFAFVFIILLGRFSGYRSIFQLINSHDLPLCAEIRLYSGGCDRTDALQAEAEGHPDYRGHD